MSENRIKDQVDKIKKIEQFFLDLSSKEKKKLDHKHVIRDIKKNYKAYRKFCKNEKKNIKRTAKKGKCKKNRKNIRRYDYNT